jgi:protein TonB
MVFARIWLFARIAFALPLGAAVTAGLLFMMHLFIENGHGQSETTSARIVEFVRIEQPEAIQKKDQRPDKPEALERVPDLASPVSTAAFDNSIGINIAAAPTLEYRANINGVSMTVSDGEYLPIVKVAPIYPTRALQRRLEGYVIVEFVVTSTGSVRDVSVVESSSPLFEEAALEAALKFKYKPRVVDGLAIEVAGVKNLITFKLDG